MTMQHFDPEILKKLFVPSPISHKGDNGRVLLIGGSTLFHAAGLWSLEIASRIVDMVFYSSVPENNAIVADVKKNWRGGIVIPRQDIEHYINEADAILIGPGMVRGEVDTTQKISSLEEINRLQSEAEQSYFLTKYLLGKYPQKKWIIDAGALQMLELEWLKKTNGNVVLTPNIGEFDRLFHLDPLSSNVQDMATRHKCIIVLKRHIDTVCSPTECLLIEGGNAGMTKGGTGDVLSGLIASLACRNELFLAAVCGSYLNKKAGESLFAKQGVYFNATDLANEIPQVMGKLLL